MKKSLSSTLKRDTSELRNNASNIRGDCTGIFGNCTGVSGDLDQCELTEEDRVRGVDIRKLIVNHIGE
jgi:hypothetical protein